MCEEKVELNERHVGASVCLPQTQNGDSISHFLSGVDSQSFDKATALPNAQ